MKEKKILLFHISEKKRDLRLYTAEKSFRERC